jgi:hypothetical protein
MERNPAPQYAQEPRSTSFYKLFPQRPSRRARRCKPRARSSRAFLRQQRLQASYDGHDARFTQRHEVRPRQQHGTKLSAALKWLTLSPDWAFEQLSSSFDTNSARPHDLPKSDASPDAQKRGTQDRQQVFVGCSQCHGVCLVGSFTRVLGVSHRHMPSAPKKSYG